MSVRTEVGDQTDTARPPEVEEFPGLCRVCGKVVPRPSDLTSCTPTLCSEGCLAQVIVEYWARFGVQARVHLREGFARLEAIPGVFPPA
jgi:hypothetical protein